MSLCNRVLVIGLQEVTLDLIRPWAEDGTLPTLKRMMDEGVSGPLRSSVPFCTPYNWANIVTGMGAGRHGVFDHWQRGVDGGFRPCDRSSLREKPLWTILHEHGLRPAVMNLPLTFPPDAAGGFMISGSDAPGVNRTIADPPEVFDQIMERFGSYRPSAVFPGGRQKSDYLGLFDRETTRQTDVYEHLLSTHPWDFALVYFVDAAMAQHYFWADMAAGDNNPYQDVLRTAYRCLDASIARLIAIAGPETMVFVVSECGAGPLRYGVQINAWLQQQGFLSWKRPASVHSRGVSHWMRSTLRTWSKLGRAMAQRHVPESLRFWLNQRFPALKKTDVTNPAIDWSRTRAFAQGKEGSIFINLAGRDPYGIVTPGTEYEAVRQDIIDRLGALRDPDTNEPAVTRVYRREELFSGPMIASAPDLLVEWRDGMYMPTEEAQDSDKVFVTRWRKGMSWPTSGSHRLEGVFIATGPGMLAGTEITGASIFDLLPTWLELLGLPIPPDLEGHPIEGVTTQIAYSG